MCIALTSSVIYVMAVLPQQDTIAQVFLTRYEKTNVSPNHNRKENFLRPCTNKNPCLPVNYADVSAGSQLP